MDNIKPEGKDADFDKKIIRKDENKLLFNAVLSLPAAYKDVVILFYYQELNTIEISKTLDIAEGTVRSRLHRAREILKNKLGGRIDYSE
jgi:RNA polymerase sigma-70 factor (ECF subfamily)